jgi:hypothetical protein
VKSEPFRALVLKPSRLGLVIDDEVECQIIGAHSEHDNSALYLPVRLTVVGEILLNLSRRRDFIEVLGMSSDLWIGARFRVSVVSAFNPATKELGLGWSLIPDSIVGGSLVG